MDTAFHFTLNVCKESVQFRIHKSSEFKATHAWLHTLYAKVQSEVKSSVYFCRFISVLQCWFWIKHAVSIVVITPIELVLPMDYHSRVDSFLGTVSEFRGGGWGSENAGNGIHPLMLIIKIVYFSRRKKRQRLAVSTLLSAYTPPSSIAFSSTWPGWHCRLEAYIFTSYPTLSRPKAIYYPTSVFRLHED